MNSGPSKFTEEISYIPVSL